MALTLEIMDRVLPTRDPPWQPESPVERAKVEELRRLDGGDGPYSRGYRWQKYVTQLLRRSRSWMSDSLAFLGSPSPFLQQAVGYIETEAPSAFDPRVAAAARGTDWLFGAVLYDLRGPDVAAARDGGFSIDLGLLDAGARGIPVVRVMAADIPHAPHVAGATSACWAGVRGSSAVDLVLTAKHAVSGFSRNQSVAMAGGGLGTLVDFCDGAVDAALVRPPAAASAPSAVAMDVDPAVGIDVEFTGVVSQHRSGRITQTWVFPADSDIYDAQRVHFDCAGTNGDSGALVRAVASGKAVGIYVGTKKTSGSNLSGAAQAIWQPTDLLGVDLYD